MSTTFKTPAGTVLPILNLRGKDYLTVAYRIVWFREVYPSWRIVTEFLIMEPEFTVAKASIINEIGNCMATAHKSETSKGFADHMEKAETGAIGRALALVGFGTAFCADDLDEGARLADAPIEKPKFVVGAGSPIGVPVSEMLPDAPSIKSSVKVSSKAQLIKNLQEFDPSFKVTEFPPTSESVTTFDDLGNYEIPFGKVWKGQKLKNVDPHGLEGFIKWCEDKAIKDGKSPSRDLTELRQKWDRFAKTSPTLGLAGSPDDDWGPLSDTYQKEIQAMDESYDNAMRKDK